MAFTRITDPTNNIAALPVQPTIPAATLQQKFDQIGQDLKTYVNNTLLPEAESTTDGDSGADNVGATPLTGGTANTVQGILEEIDAYSVKKTGNQTIAGIKTFSSSPVVPTATNSNQAINKAQLDAHVIDQIPNDSITNDKLATDVKVGSLAGLNALLTGFKTSVTTAINKVVSWIGDLTSLLTTDKTSLVNAINEVRTENRTKPTEVQIVTGFPSGWSGFIVGSVFLESLKDIHINVTKSTDITVGSTILYTLPLALRPVRNRFYPVSLNDVAGNLISTAYVTIITDGTVMLYAIGTLTNARVVNATFNYI